MEKIDYGKISDEEYIAVSSRILASWANSTLEPVVFGKGASRALKDLKKRSVAFFCAMRNHFAREHLNRKRALAIGFKPWSEERPDLLLIPLWYCGILEEGQEVTFIGGDVQKYSRTDTDHDIRYGVTSFGFEFKPQGAKGEPDGERGV